jgi:23S rRNA pseudouridine2604 synthase
MADINQAVQGSSKTAINTAQPKQTTANRTELEDLSAAINNAETKSKSKTKQNTPAKPSSSKQENTKDVWPYNSHKSKD